MRTKKRRGESEGRVGSRLIAPNQRGVCSSNFGSLSSSLYPKQPTVSILTSPPAEHLVQEGGKGVIIDLIVTHQMIEIRFL
jgi:hypothetical protein